MEKLEIKHLAPYLPYGLEMEISNGSMKTIRLLQLDLGHDFNLHLSLGNVKPILRPLSDLTETIIDKGFFIIPASEISYMCSAAIEDCIETYEKLSSSMMLGDRFTYKTIDYFFSLKFDVFGLIEKGLAIDVNTLIVNPYE